MRVTILTIILFAFVQKMSSQVLPAFHGVFNKKSGLSGNFSQLGSDINGEASYDYSGEMISMSGDGNRIAIGAHLNDGTASAAGHVRVYEYSNNSWSQLGSDIDGEAGADYFGSSVALDDDGTTVAIGGIYNDGGGDKSGHVRVYQYSNNSWSQLGSDIDGEAAGDYSGIDVAISDDGTIVAIGAYSNDANGSNSGHVRVYDWDGKSWSQLGIDIDGDAAGDGSGYSISLSNDGTILAVGSPFNNDASGDDSGQIKVYQYSTGTVYGEVNENGTLNLNTPANSVITSVAFASYGTPTGSDGSYSTSSCHSATSGSVVATACVGNASCSIAATNGNFGDPCGGTYKRLYVKLNYSTWTQLGSDIEGQNVNEFLGSDVALNSDGTILAAGGWGYNSMQGVVKVYEYSNSSWSQLGSNIVGEATGDRTVYYKGLSMSEDGTIVGIGAYLNHADNGNDTGNMRVYQYSSSSWSQLGSDLDGDEIGDKYGWSISISDDGTRIAVSAREGHGNGLNNNGYVRIFTID